MFLKHHLFGGFIALLMSCFTAQSATINITAEYTPSVFKVDDGKFENTTPQSGFCLKWPHYCNNAERPFSIQLPLITTLKSPIQANDSPRQSVYFNFPKKIQEVTVSNSKTQETFNIKFRITHYAATFSSALNYKEWNEGSFVSPPAGGGCGYSGVSVMSSGWYSFMWKTHNNSNPCYKISKLDRTEPSRFYDMSIGYSIVASDSLAVVSSGLYTGSLTFSVGPDGDFDFGDNYEVNDSELVVNFTLSVNHDLNIITLPASRNVALQPCNKGKLCTEEQGKVNWERWMVTKIAPELTGQSQFIISSSGAFLVYLQCEYQMDGKCAIKSDNDSELIPVESYLTLPNNIIHYDSGNAVIDYPLLLNKDLRNTLMTKSPNSNMRGHIDFLIQQSDVEKMLSRPRPDVYRGIVTVIFDPNIF